MTASDLKGLKVVLLAVVMLRGMYLPSVQQADLTPL